MCTPTATLMLVLVLLPLAVLAVASEPYDWTSLFPPWERFLVILKQKHIIFDPIPRVEGIDPSEDPLRELRAPPSIC